MSNVETDMIQIDSAEQMREKVKLMVKQEKEKNIRAIYAKNISAIVEGNCKNYIDKAYNLYSGDQTALVDFEREYYQKVINDLKKLLKTCFFAKYQGMTQIQVINAWFADMENGGTSIDTTDEEAIIEEIKKYSTKTLTGALKIYLNDILTKI